MYTKYFKQLLTTLFSLDKGIPRNSYISLRLGPSFWRNMATTADEGSKRNRLAKEKSPYLLQHATNPVDWFPWCKEAFEKAKSENKVIFLSVGYSTCHWCHVMERESFEKEEVANVMNQNFVNIKVDREERPDIDRIYMTYVQASTGSGGWPMSVWLTPDLKPIVGGTYFPPDDRYYGRSGFTTVLNHIAKQWQENRAKVEDQSNRILLLLQESVDLTKGCAPSTAIVHICYDQMAKSYDKINGGFNDAPKFPQPVNFNFLLRYYLLNWKTEKGEHALEMVLHTLRMMAKGGIHDHVSKGFHRYSTNSTWHVPHFEKMLYDQSQLCVSYLDAYQITGNLFFAKVARDILEYVERDLRHQSGGCYSAEDADSLATADAKEKREGAFCVWTLREIQNLFGESQQANDRPKMADVFCKHFMVKQQGNVEPYKVHFHNNVSLNFAPFPDDGTQDPHCELKDQNVLMETGTVQETAQHFGISEARVTEALERGKHLLHDARQRRPKPHLDDKMIASWNGLMLSAFARAAQVLKDEQFLEATQKLAQFIFQHMYNKDKKQLIRCVYRGTENQVDYPENPIPGVLDDYCCVIRGLLDAYGATFDLQWLEWAYDLQETQDELFWDQQGCGGYFSCIQGDPQVVLHIKADQDGAEPSGNSLAVANLTRLGRLYDRVHWTEKAGQLLEAFGEPLGKTPFTLPQMVAGFMHLGKSDTRIIIRGKQSDPAVAPFLNCINEHYDPFKTVLLVDSQIEMSRLANVVKDTHDTKDPVTVSICRNNTCLPSITSVEELRKLLQQTIPYNSP